LYNEARTHLSLSKEAPIPREVQGVGRIFCKATSRRTASPIRPDLIYDKYTGPIPDDHVFPFTPGQKVSPVKIVGFEGLHLPATLIADAKTEALPPEL
jgi:hypothetical protein